MKKIIENLELILANSYSLYLKTQNYHWNVTGQNFKTLHELFALHYEELIPAIDILAERIRTLGSKVDGSYENFAKLTKFKSADKNLKNDAMVKDLIAANNVVIDLLKNGVLIAQKDSDDATADILIGRIEAHQKNVWMLNSSL